MPRSLAPGLLVATPPLNDPNFVHALILMVAHGDEGALGIVVNGEREVARLGDLLEQLGLSDDGRTHADPVRLGGPVQPELGWIVYQPTEGAPREGEIRLSAAIAVTQSREVLASIGRNDGPPQYAAYLGYTGWAPGQLEDEIREGAWIPLPLDASIVFDVPFEKRWKVAYERAGVAIAAVLGSKNQTRGSA
ncbi:MAG: YqgE/AlgH family protein [Polyangiales bacterium]